MMISKGIRPKAMRMERNTKKICNGKNLDGNWDTEVG